jgi:pyruvate kinase
MATPHYKAKAKILCTMGPAVASAAKVVNMVRAGANAFRLNMSHGSYTTHEEFIGYIRAAEEKLSVHIPIVVDLQGPKIRVGEFGPDIRFLSLVNGREVVLADQRIIRAKKLDISNAVIPVQYATLAKDVKKGDQLLLDDGLLKLQVIKINGDLVTCIVVHGGELKPRKGINLPQTHVSAPSITSKDRADVRFAIEHDCDYIALSFVRTASDIENIRKYIQKYGGTQPVIAKIEKPEALKNIHEIVHATDLLMVARGDLGVEIPAERVPMVQKELITLCNDHAKPVITATQMLDSMINNPRPTRAEASDVANAVLDGTDAVMLSGETSVGAYPIQAVQYMRQICNEAEIRVPAGVVEHDSPANTVAIAKSAAQLAEEAHVAAITSLSYSGETVRLISSFRPQCPVFGITTLRSTARRMGLFWGVTGMVLEELSSINDSIDAIKASLLSEKILSAGSTFVVTTGRPLIGRARTNMLSLETVEAAKPISQA